MARASSIEGFLSYDGWQEAPAQSSWRMEGVGKSSKPRANMSHNFTPTCPTARVKQRAGIERKRLAEQVELN